MHGGDADLNACLLRPALAVFLECRIVTRLNLALQARQIICGDAARVERSLSGLQGVLVAVLFQVSVDAGETDEEALSGLLGGVVFDLDGVNDALPEIGADGVHGLVCIILNRKENRCYI